VCRTRWSEADRTVWLEPMALRSPVPMIE